MRLLVLNTKSMKSAMRLLESTIWGGWEKVPPITKRKIERMEYERAKMIVNEYECAELAKEQHKGHYKCTEVDCIL